MKLKQQSLDFDRMEGQAVAEGDNNRRMGGTDDNNIGNNNINGSNTNIVNSNEGPTKPKRQMKTPFQLETLERAYALNKYLSETMRVELSMKLRLTKRQLQMWFSHRRFMDRKNLAPKKPPQVAAVEPLAYSPMDDLRLGVELGNEYGSGSGSGSTTYARLDSQNVVPWGVPRLGSGSSPYARSDPRNVVPQGVPSSGSGSSLYPRSAPWNVVPRGVPRLGLGSSPDARSDPGNVVPQGVPRSGSGSSPYAQSDLGNVFPQGVPGSGSGSSPYVRSDPRNVVPWGVPNYYESSQAMMKLRAIACVEEQLGEPLREDGPVLGVEFDPLPPDAFGPPIAVRRQQKRPRFAYDSTTYERRETRTNEAMTRTFRENHFLPNQSRIRSGSFGQLGQSYLRDPMEGSARNPSSACGNEQLPRSHTTQRHPPRVRLLSQRGKQGISYQSPPQDDDVSPQRELYTNIANIGMNSQVGPENPHHLTSGQDLHNNEMRTERKRKSNDARFPREVEGHEIRIQKELEKQDNPRQKSEERLRKEMERQDRERRKEEERLMREQQREEERARREQQRQIERREKFLQKENLRAEKMRQKEELRKEKETERRKAALEKATARRIAKESLELVEDEQLEMMELAASSKGISSIVNLDFDTLQNIESFRDSLSVFPPKSVKLRKPFAIEPWINSEENVGNLLMVWRFLITFAGDLGLWPFTLDEFVQAFHDYDSRLLGEIHIALLKVIIKDIEEVARTPTGLGMNQNGAANSGGGHPQIVEGAHAWGFDIPNWQKHLNQLTWQEIFRQLALSAGHGPQFKKRSITYANDKDKGRSCEDIISTLRNGSAAKNAVAKMLEKGLLAPRRSRHRLTPGTVKFAAFHVLSLEGSKGLTVLELAEKIQKSGLRDLTNSKTPEASISVALTRDTKLFERIAPSTYCVRDAFRKDPADAESILSEARKKIQKFENGFQAGEDADDVEREEDSESDELDEDPEIGGLVNLSSPNKRSKQCDNSPNAATEQPGASEDLNAGYLGENNMKIDEGKPVEPWVVGLAEGEYSDLSIEERLNALVVLIGMANEGNTIRVVLEDRSEAANALKKRICDVQTDKVRLKDDSFNKSDFPSDNGNKFETQYTCPAVEGNQSPLHNNIGNNNSMPSPSAAVNQKSAPVVQSLSIEKHSSFRDLCTDPDNPQTRPFTHCSTRSRCQLKSCISQTAEMMCAYRSLPLGQDRRFNRYWQFVASNSSHDPGSGRIFVEYNDGNWRLIDSEEAFDALLNSLDSRGIRECHLCHMLKEIESSFKENVRNNTQSSKIERRGETCVKSGADEADSSPDRHTGSDSPSSTLRGLNSETSEISSSFKIELGKSDSDKISAFIRYLDYQKWMWARCYNSDILCAMNYGKKKPQLVFCKACPYPCFLEDSNCNFCGKTFPSYNGLTCSKHAFQSGDKSSEDIFLDSSIPVRTSLLKALLASIEVSVPPEAFQSIWTEDFRRHWLVKLCKSSSAGELLQILIQFEGALKRDFLSSTFSTTGEHTSMDLESVAVPAWVPLTTSAVCLRLLQLDTSIVYIPHEEKEDREYMLPSRFNPSKSKKVAEPADLDHDELKKVKSPVKIGRSDKKRGQGGRDQGWGNTLSKTMYGSKQDTSHRKVMVPGNPRQIQQQGEGSQVPAVVRGPRTVRKRRVENWAVKDLLLGHRGATHRSSAGKEPLRSLNEDRDDGNASPMGAPDIGYSAEEAKSDGNARAMESDDNVQAVEYDQGNRKIGFNGTPNSYSMDLVGMNDEDAEASEDYKDNDSGQWR